LAIAAFLASIPHKGYDNPFIVADGLNTISAPFNENPSQCKG